MPEDRGVSRGDERWARFRFSVVGPLLAAPLKSGELKGQIEQLAEKQWKHPTRQETIRLGASTIERWYYTALGQQQDPVGALARKIRSDEGTCRSLSNGLRAKLLEQYKEHPAWTYQLHRDNLVALVELDPDLGHPPSYPSVRRFMQSHGMMKRRRLGRRDTAGARAAERRFALLEIRSYESEYVNALWHLDFHRGSLKVLLNDGQWTVPSLLGILDDHSRICPHAQWYLAETAENLAHGMCQGFEKRDLPRAIMMDKGAAMIALETVEGLQRLGIVQERTLCYSPYPYVASKNMWRGDPGSPSLADTVRVGAT